MSAILVAGGFGIKMTSYSGTVDVRDAERFASSRPYRLMDGPRCDARLAIVALSTAVVTYALLFCSVPAAVAQAQPGWNASVTIPRVTIGSDNMSLEALHQTIGGTDRRLLFLTVTPVGGTSQALLPIAVAEIQAFVNAATKVLSLIAANGSPITVEGQSRPLNVSVVEIPKAGNFALLQTQAGGATVYQLQIYQAIFNPYFFRKYTAANLQQFVSYLNLGISYVNALP